MTELTDHGSNLNVHRQRNGYRRRGTFITVEYYSAIKKNETMPFVATWMDLEIIILSEVSQKKKDKYHMVFVESKI